MTPRPEWLGRVDYETCLARQRTQREAVIAGRADEVFWLVEHESIVTTGRRPTVVPDEATRARHGIALCRTERGGLATWHGPGQLVGYPIVSLRRRRLGVRDMVCGMEDGLIDWLATYGVHASRRAGAPGVWVGRDKIAALGIHVRHGVTIHGFALNLSPDLGVYELFTPCGIEDGGVTSLRALTGDAPSPEAAAVEVGEWVLRALVRRGCRI